MKYLIIGLILLSGCAKHSDTQPAGDTVVVSQASPNNDVSTSSCPSTLLSTQLIIACPEKVTSLPETLLKQGNQVFLMKKVSNGISYTFLAVGAHSTADGRDCHYEVNIDGSIGSL